MSRADPRSRRRAHLGDAARRFWPPRDCSSSLRDTYDALQGCAFWSLGALAPDFYAARSTCRRSIFQVIVKSDHSSRALSGPLMLIWLQPITRLMIPNTGSTDCLRGHTVLARFSSPADGPS